VYPFFVSVEGPYIDKNRNVVANIFLDTECDYLLTLDSDMGITNPRSENIVKRLIEADKDFIAGVYVNRVFPHKPHVFKLEKDKTYTAVSEWPEDALFEADAAGTGFMFMTQKVIQSFTEANIAKQGLPFDFWKYGTKDHLGEDLAFCKRVKNNSFKLWIDPTIQLTHFGKENHTVHDFKIALETANEISE
jgi:hypothetical protein